jgi:hypothetical protein
MANVLNTDKQIAVISSPFRSSKNMAKQTKPKIGRPKLPKGEAKGRIVPIRLNAQDAKRIESAARASQKTISEWIRGAITTAMGAQ